MLKDQYRFCLGLQARVHPSWPTSIRTQSFGRRQRSYRVSRRVPPAHRPAIFSGVWRGGEKAIQPEGVSRNEPAKSRAPFL